MTQFGLRVVRRPDHRRRTQLHLVSGHLKFWRKLSHFVHSLISTFDTRRRSALPPQGPIAGFNRGASSPQRLFEFTPQDLMPNSIFSFARSAAYPRSKSVFALTRALPTLETTCAQSWELAANLEKSKSILQWNKDDNNIVNSKALSANPVTSTMRVTWMGQKLRTGSLEHRRHFSFIHVCGSLSRTIRRDFNTS